MVNAIYKCDQCSKTVYLLEAGFGEDLKCCDQKMREMTAEEKEQYIDDVAALTPRYEVPGTSQI